MKIKILLFISSIILVIFAIFFIQKENDIQNIIESEKIEIILPDGREIIAEIADNDEERQTGLMFRENLGENEGMFFVFEKEIELSFWMKNTLIPLDIIFIDENLEIINIEKAEPCKNDPCPNYSSLNPAMYVLEINQSLELEYKNQYISIK